MYILPTVRSPGFPTSVTVSHEESGMCNDNMGEYGGGDTCGVQNKVIEDTEIPSGFLGTLTLHSQAILQPTLSPEAVQGLSSPLGGPCGYMERGRSRQPTASQVIPEEGPRWNVEVTKICLQDLLLPKSVTDAQLCCSKILQYVWARLYSPQAAPSPRLA